MIKRLKNAKPRYKILIGLWLAVELMSLPAAASVAFSLSGKNGPLVAEAIEMTEPGVAQFLVTHSVAFDILVSGVTDDVNIKIEDAKYDTDILSACANFQTTHPRIVETIDAPANDESPIGALFVTVTYDAASTPDIRFEQTSYVPAALPCQSI